MDALVKAKTGTGKTLAFLIPAIQQLIENPRLNRKDIPCIIISPSRELAHQIAAEAKLLLQNTPHLKALCITGGSSIRGDHSALQQQISFLVATPGRLIDHMRNSSGFADRVKTCQTLILDEADTLLVRRTDTAFTLFHYSLL
jgi:ATP-dependent RNA helicase MSS116